MDAYARERVHVQWSNNKLQVIVGTVAFGMGINKPDVRFVIHHSLSKSMETYYQESGRAGRDGLPSECLLYYRPADAPRQSCMVFYENSGLQNLYDIVRYAQSKRECRRTAFFQHFDEQLQDCNGMCDNCSCTSEVKEIDVTGHAAAIITLLQDFQERDQRITMLQLVDKMKFKNKSLGPEIKRDELEQLIIQLIVDRVLKEEFQHTAYATNAYVTLGLLSRQVLQGKKIIKLDVSGNKKSKGGITKVLQSLIPSGLENKLDELRKELSSVHGGTYPHSILSTQLISFLSAQRPKSLKQLEKIIGKVKKDKYGSRILEVISKYESAHPLEGDLGNELNGNRSRAAKRQKTNKALVVIESSEEEEEEEEEK